MRARPRVRAPQSGHRTGCLGRRVWAESAFEAALAIDSGNAYANYNLGRLRFVAHDLGRARDLLRAALESKAEFAEARVVLARVLEELGDLTAAEDTLRLAIAQRPEFSGALKNHGTLLARLGRWSEAADALRRAADLDPADADALYELGNAWVRLDKPELALQAYRAATTRRPDFAQAWCNQGNVLADRGSRREAVDCFSKALELNPDYANAHLGLGNVYGGVEQLEKATAHFRRALTLEPRLALAQLNLGIVLCDQGMQGEALESFRAALALDPAWPEARWALAMGHVPALRAKDERLGEIRQRIATEFESLEHWFDANAIQGGYRAVGIQQPFWLAYQEENNRSLLKTYGQLCARLMGQWQAQRGLHARGTRAPGPVRVGVVSQYFRHHSVWHAIVRGWFQKLDKARFSLFAFCLDPEEDAETRLARSLAARFEQGHIGLDRWAEVIADAQPDVLIYPEIGMDPMSVKLASLRLAPVQAATWGHPETTGLPTIDHYLSAEAMEPPQAQDHYTEKLRMLPNLGCYVERLSIEPASVDLATWGIDDQVPLLISPGSPFKYAPEHDWIFPEIARRLGRCHLLFFSYRVGPLAERFQARLRQEFSTRGLDFDRFASFIPWQEKATFYGLLGRAHAYLDTVGFSGFNTALQAIQCDLPVVTIEGRFLRGRLASGILRRMGLPELVAPDDQRYVDLAVRLADDVTYRDSVRQRMRSARHVLFEDLEALQALEEFLAQGV
ncbi:MAG: tetratricopeptide repeat protein [Betaproteobacteria bacterium]|nr:tetratricopeptide repeat protein [Betaproteobacteria bacterium]